METAYFTQPLSFVIGIVIDLYAIAILLRFLLQWLRADFYNPFSQFLVTVTSPVLRPLRKVIPGWGGIDLAALLLFFVVVMLKLSMLGWLDGAVGVYQYRIPWPEWQALPLLLLGFADAINTIINLYLFVIFIQVIISWVAPHQYNPVVGILQHLSAPLLRPARRLLPPIGGLDLSPMLVIILLWVSKMLLLPPIIKLSLHL